MTRSAIREGMALTREGSHGWEARGSVTSGSSKDLGSQEAA